MRKDRSLARCLTQSTGRRKPEADRDRGLGGQEGAPGWEEGECVAWGRGGRGTLSSLKGVLQAPLLLSPQTLEAGAGSRGRSAATVLSGESNRFR